MEGEIMLIVIDFDGTYTNDPALWDAFIKMAKENYHEVFCATMRYEDTEGDLVKKCLEGKVDRIIFTNRLGKIAEVRKQTGRNPDIWIDDDPAWLFDDAI